MELIHISDNIYTDKGSISRLFGEFISDIDNVTDIEIDECILYSQENNWHSWENAFKQWKTQGVIK